MNIRGMERIMRTKALMRFNAIGDTYSGDSNHFDDVHTDWWYFGFDCGHWLDLVDYESAMRYGLMPEEDYMYPIGVNNVSNRITEEGAAPTIKTQEFVEEICKLIVEQLKRVEGNSNDG